MSMPLRSTVFETEQKNNVEGILNPCRMIPSPELLLTQVKLDNRSQRKLDSDSGKTANSTAWAEKDDAITIILLALPAGGKHRQRWTEKLEDTRSCEKYIPRHRPPCSKLPMPPL